MKHLLLITTFLGLLLLGINGCGNKEQKDFSEYISGYTSGMVTAESPIYIYLAKPADKSFQAGSVLPAKLVNFTPAVKGECMLKDEHTVMFTPETPLKNGETYQVAFQLGNICTVENVIPLSILFEPGKLTIEPDNTNALQYQGSLICSDYMEAKEVEKLVSGTFKGTSLVPVWEHAGNRHYFRFRDLEKSDKEEVLQLNFKKEVSNEKTVRIPIPGKNIFNVLNIEISDSSPAVISIYMSENIDPEQDLKGLVIRQLQNRPKRHPRLPAFFILSENRRIKPISGHSQHHGEYLAKHLHHLPSIAVPQTGSRIYWQRGHCAG